MEGLDPVLSYASSARHKGRTLMRNHPRPEKRSHNMSNEVAVDKIKVGLAIKVRTKVQLEKLAAKNGSTWNDEAVAALERATKNVELSSEDYARIASIVRKNEEKRAKKRERGA